MRDLRAHDPFPFELQQQKDKSDMTTPRRAAEYRTTRVTATLNEVLCLLRFQSVEPFESVSKAVNTTSVHSFEWLSIYMPQLTGRKRVECPRAPEGIPMHLSNDAHHRSPNPNSSILPFDSMQIYNIDGQIQQNLENRRDQQNARIMRPTHGHTAQNQRNDRTPQHDGHRPFLLRDFVHRPQWAAAREVADQRPEGEDVGDCAEYAEWNAVQLDACFEGGGGVVNGELLRYGER